MKEYRVRWEIDLDASSHKAAAKLALKIMRDPTSMATHFLVTDGDYWKPIVLPPARRPKR